MVQLTPADLESVAELLNELAGLSINTDSDTDLKIEEVTLSLYGRTAIVVVQKTDVGEPTGQFVVKW